MFGGVLIALGVFAGGLVTGVMQVFPLSILGVLLIFVAFELAHQSRDVKHVEEWLIIAATALIGFAYGMLAGVVIGLTLAYALQFRAKRMGN